MAYKIQDLVFNNGLKMPVIGLGTWNSSTDDVGKALDFALEIGYRHIDTAYVYGNETQIGHILKKWTGSGNLKREELFIVTKLPSVGNRPESVEKFLKKSLENLQLDYVDLYLIHQPVGVLEEKDKNGINLIDPNTDIVATWKAMEAQVYAGRAKSIGLSNFNSEQIKRIWKSAQIKPANLQVELHVYFQQRELVAFCNALDITVVAYGPIGSPQWYQTTYAKLGKDHNLPYQNPLTDPVVKHIAEKHNKSAAQVLLRHIVQRGVAVIPKSVNTERIKENFNIFDFELTAEEVGVLDALDKGPKGRQFTGAVMPSRMKHHEFPFKIHY